MSTKWWLLIISCMVLSSFVLICGVLLYGKGDKPQSVCEHKQNVPLYINNKQINNQYVNLYNYNTMVDHRAEVPLLVILEELGYSIFWENDVSATLTNGKTRLELVLSELPSLMTEDGEELLAPIPGATYFYAYANGRDLIVDTLVLRFVLSRLDIDAKVWENCDSNSAYISIKTGSSNLN